MAAAANWIGTPKTWLGQVSTANTARDGSGTIATIVTAGSGGTRIDHIEIQATGTTTAGQIRLFLHDGTNARLWREISVTAVTPNTSTTPAWHYEMDGNSQNEVLTYSTPQRFIFLPLILQTGWSLRASTNNAETFNIIAHGGDF